MKVPISKKWNYDIDLEYTCRNFTQDKNGNQRRMINSAGVVTMLARKTNFLASQHQRVIFQRLHSDADIYNSGATTQILHQGRYLDYADNERTYLVRILALPRTSGSGDAIATFMSTDSYVYNYTEATKKFPKSLFMVDFEVARGSPSDGFVTQSLEIDNGFAIVDIVVQPKLIDQFDTSVAYQQVTSMLPDGLTTGDPIIEGYSKDIRDVLHYLRSESYAPISSWYANKTSSGWGTPSAPGDNTGMTATNTDYVNALNQNITRSGTGRTATTPGIYAPAQYMGKGPTDEDDGKSIKLYFSVLATATSTDGYVALEGPDHDGANMEAITVTAGAGPNWYDSSGYVKLNTAVGYSDTTTERNKIDIWLKNVWGNLHVYAIEMYLKL